MVISGVDSAMPPIRVIIADDEKNEDVAIKVSDEGGGIPRSQLAKIWSYFFTTAQETALANMLNVESSDGVFTGFERMDSPLAGLGEREIAMNYCILFTLLLFCLHFFFAQ